MTKYKVYGSYQTDDEPKVSKPEMLPEPRIVRVQDGIPLQFPPCEGALVRVLHPTNPNAPSKNFGISMLYLPPHAVLQTASHEPEECYAVLEGEGEMTFVNGKRTVKKGDFIHLPPWALHGIENTSDEMLIVLVATSPTNP